MSAKTKQAATIEEEIRIVVELIATLEEQIEDPMASAKDIEHDTAVIELSKLRWKTLVNRQAGTLDANESYVTTDGRQYVVNELTGIAEPDITSATPGDKLDATAKDMEGYEKKAFLAEVDFGKSHNIDEGEVYSWWIDVRGNGKLTLEMALANLHLKIVEESKKRLTTTTIDIVGECPWVAAPIGAYEAVLETAKNLGVDALTVQNLWTPIAIAQGSGTYTNFGLYCLVQSVQCWYANRELRAVADAAICAHNRLVSVPTQQPTKRKR